MWDPQGSSGCWWDILNGNIIFLNWIFWFSVVLNGIMKRPGLGGIYADMWSQQASGEDVHKPGT